MKWWFAGLSVAALVFIISKGGLGAVFGLARVLAPFIIFYYVVRTITHLIFPSTKAKKPLSKDSSEDDPDVIRICPDCGREEKSCFKCKVGFGPSS